ncbi:hypothetical protein HA402_003604 [Bradysia odoriphaga]|nr:hypothetical protein HA402_003604 [Bradysia odoriphaga]
MAAIHSDDETSDIEQLAQFPSGGYSDESTIAYLQHPCVVLTALELLGYSVVASSSTPVKQDYNEYMWTMRRDFPGQQFSPDSASLVDRDNISNIGREASATTKNKSDA